MNVVAQLKDKGEVTRGWLGVLIQDVTRELAESFGMERPSGALVAKVLENSPAGKAGIQEGDVIVEFNGKAIDYSSDLPPMVGRAEVGREARVKLIRDRKPKMVNVRIAELPAEDQLADSSEQGGAADDRLGIAVADLTAEQRRELGLGKQGLLVADVGPGAAFDAGVRRGDILLKLGGTGLESSAQFKKLVKELPAGKSVPLLVQRRNGSLYLALRLPDKK
jgi:serine protease Do